MPIQMKNQPIKPFDYKKSAETILKTLRRDRDRQIIAKRFGFDLPKRQTLGRIGEDFGITRERVRQIEKATLAKMQQTVHSETRQAGQLLADYTKAEGGVALLSDIAAKIGAKDSAQQAYILFLATLVRAIDVTFDSEQ